ncbi:sialate O-acetylesterase [Wenyingzhuangia heitensis]|uniref:Sialate O-acetylesterase n=1 Tax=Wenyingzhuangia heitensis TaxID=1487859 RepID=A0ABX0U7Q8_9FLAO|nr:sialate O-acetylesterase [Wenyingzhuangia heitensis]NIJ44880.1 sialate O-acetylesterase [Wenyingzhuangia heitensis]
MNYIKIVQVLVVVLGITTVKAEVVLPKFFSDHMVLQRNNNNPIWGTAQKGEKIMVSIAGQSHQTKADKNGYWKIRLDKMKAGGPYKLIVQGDNKIELNDVLIGEVWLCSGQSNMGWKVGGTTYADLEIASANYPNIRLLKAPLQGSLTKQYDLDAQWEKCSPENVGSFSANGYFFGRRLHQVLGVPIGLINVAWGASALETWIPREAMDAAGTYTEMLSQWDERMSNFTDKTLKKETKAYEVWVKSGKKGKNMSPVRDHRIGQNTPANGFNYMVHPILGYGIKGAIWCQGETNLGRSYQYRRMFPLLINTWRELWGQGDFSFYWIQVAGMKTKPTAPEQSYWAEMREAQTMTLKLPNTAEAVVYDLGEGNNIHFKDKQSSANRLVLHALSKDYNYKIKANSPSYESMKVKGNKITITFKDVSSKLYAFDVSTVKGFTIAGKDQKFVFAKAKIIGKNKVEVFANEIENPVAVRFAWANNPDANLYDKTNLPVTAFRTDNWHGISYQKEKANR